jgi:hypothetical protein
MSFNDDHEGPARVAKTPAVALAEPLSLLSDRMQLI